MKSRLCVSIALAVCVVVLGAPRPAAAGNYGRAEWYPLRKPAVVGCVKGNPGCDGYHSYWAIDLWDPDQKDGDPIYAAGKGWARIIQRGDSCGGSGTPANIVLIDHANGVQTMYVHLSKFNIDAGGQWVTPNTIIGRMGATGHTSPCPFVHLHFEKRKKDASGVYQKVNPGPLKACRGTKLVTYPKKAGYSSWNDIPAHEETLRSDGTSC